MTIHHTPTASSVLPYYLGRPVWACPGYVGKVIAPGAKRHEYLHQYSIAFNTVEGNRTFYGLPTLDTARRWVARLASSRGPQAPETWSGRSVEWNARSGSTSVLKFLVLRTQLEASWATPRAVFR